MKNPHQGERVRGLEHLDELAKQKRAVFTPSLRGFATPRPAAFIVNQIGSQLLRLFDEGMYVYESKKPLKEKLK